ncbi:hypothetical protein ES319_A02G154100v1 [Gossypium barbadense]|uniref:Uncharacterized protein n=2 Tax=Gossypium TaxID=3633 RepID=A0A5J5WRF7_GOSBA|nr:hypothetical protein ES319_A02G154100v1 [Gossypium barbadense]TYI40562.1 hypothetical protein ES332_A02G171800v1 [Gossypium tomentosum]
MEAQNFQQSYTLAMLSGWLGVGDRRRQHHNIKLLPLGY